MYKGNPFWILMNHHLGSMPPRSSSITLLAKLSIIRLVNEQRPTDEITQIFGVSIQDMARIVGQTRPICLRLFNEGWTNRMVSTATGLSVDSLVLIRWTLRYLITVNGNPSHGGPPSHGPPGLNQHVFHGDAPEE